MSNTVKETITVTFVGKFGPKVGEVWYPLSQKSGLTPANFVKGQTYNVLVYTSGTGKKYINQLLGETAPSAVQVAPAVEKAGGDKILQAPEPARPVYKQRDFDAETRGKVACVSYQAALASPALAMFALNKEDYLKAVDEIAERMIKFVFDHQNS